MAKSIERIEARRLRRGGRSIKDISKSLGVSKSTVSLWCCGIELSKKQIDVLRQKMIKAGYEGRLKGAKIQKQKRLRKINFYQEQGLEEMGKMSKRDLLLFGLGLYLGEGNKNGNNFQFVNSNPDVIRMIIKWLRLFDINKGDFYCNIIINHIHAGRVDDVQRRWVDITGFSPGQFKKTILIKSVNKKIYENQNSHLGTLVLRVYKSSDLLYKILGLIHGLSCEIINRAKPA